MPWPNPEEIRRREIVRAKMAEDAARVPDFDAPEPKSRRRGRYPRAGNSESIMRNRVLRAASFGLHHDGLYDR